MEKEKYTIVLPVKNGGNFVKDCVYSILSQTLTAFKLVILENCSTDGTAEWLRLIKDDRVRIYTAPQPLSIAENWSRITMVPKNEFTTCIGHDDLLLPHYLEEMDRLIAKHPSASLYQTHFTFIDKNGGLLRHCLPMAATQTAEELLACLLTKTLDSMGTGYLFRSKDYDAYGGIPTRYPDLLFADNELWIYLSGLSYKATAFKNCFQYRIHQSLSRTTGGDAYYESFHQYMVLLKNLTETNTKMKEIIERYGSDMLYKYCESVAHRLLKTSMDKRNLQIKQFVAQCRQYAMWLIPGQDFEPLSKTRIRLATAIDGNFLLRNFFQIFRKYYQKPI